MLDLASVVEMERLCCWRPEGEELGPAVNLVGGEGAATYGKLACEGEIYSSMPCYCSSFIEERRDFLF